MVPALKASLAPELALTARSFVPISFSPFPLESATDLDSNESTSDSLMMQTTTSPKLPSPPTPSSPRNPSLLLWRRPPSISWIVRLRVFRYVTINSHPLLFLQVPCPARLVSSPYRAELLELHSQTSQTRISTALSLPFDLTARCLSRLMRAWRTCSRVGF